MQGRKGGTSHGLDVAPRQEEAVTGLRNAGMSRFSTCPGCKKPFQQTRPDKRTCGPKCRQRVSRKARGIGWKPVGAIVAVMRRKG